MRQRGAILALALLAACSPERENAAAPIESVSQPPAIGAVESAPAPAAAWVLSADGFGPIRIGMTPDEASAAYGHAFIGDGVSEPGATCETFVPADHAPHEGLRLLARDGRISRISDHGSASVRTAEGIGVGSTGEAVRDAYPAAARRTAPYIGEPAYELIAWRVPEQSGVLFSIGLDGVVSTVHAGDATILWIEGCL